MTVSLKSTCNPANWTLNNVSFVLQKLTVFKNNIVKLQYIIDKFFVVESQKMKKI